MAGAKPTADPGWYLDAHDPAQEQYWDGERWTEARRPISEGDGAASGLTGTGARWEYRIEQIPLQEKWFGKQQQEFQRFVGKFTTAGDQGWELVSYQAMPMHGAITGNHRQNIFLAIFKRPKG